jgi:glutathione peroxidase
MHRVLASLLVLCACDSGATSDAKASRSVDASAETKKTEAEPKADTPPEKTVAEAPKGEGPVLDHTVKAIDGSDKSLADFRGKALLVVNTASQCGYTPQYEGLQELYAKYKERGFEVLAFPSNDFGAQEPGSEDEIASFVDDRYGVQFPMFAKVPVKGDGKVPLYTTLTEKTPDGIKGEIKWNFTKFLVDPQGHVIARFEPNVDPMDADLTGKLESVLPAQG